MGLESNAAGDSPKIAQTAYVHHTAALIGRVSIEGKVFVGPHALGGTVVRISPGSSVAHGAVIHGPCEIGANCFVGFGSVVFNATLGDGAVVMHRALVEGVTVPSGVYVPSMAAVRCKEDVRRSARATPDIVAFAKKVSRANILLVEAALNSRTSK
jgi:carbonic anhydrase/acetyltransferase-like protein (isoleucine patch superfamily)